MPRQRGNGAACRGKRSAQHSGPGSPEELAACLTRGGDSLIAMDRGGTKSWYLYDGHGSVRMLANDTGRTTDTWSYDAWGETTSRTGVTENDYQYAGERFDRTTELYQLRARYMDPKTGTFLSLDPYQGNRHDPASLHKYMYANANPVNNVDPTGLTSIAEMSGAMAGQGILAGSNGLNFAAMLGLMGGRAKAIVGATIALSLLTEKFMEAVLSGDIRFVELSGILARTILDTLTVPNKVANSIAFSQSLFLLEEIKGAIDRLNKDPRKIGHISQEKHNWKQKLGFDPKDPKDWDKITAIISTVLAVGTKEPFGSAWRTTVEVFIWTSQGFVKEILEVRYFIKEGLLTIGTAFVQW